MRNENGDTSECEMYGMHKTLGWVERLARGSTAYSTIRLWRHCANRPGRSLPFAISDSHAALLSNRQLNLQFIHRRKFEPNWPLKTIKTIGNPYRLTLSILAGVHLWMHVFLGYNSYIVLYLRVCRCTFLGLAKGAGQRVFALSGMSRGCCMRGIVLQSQFSGISIRGFWTCDCLLWVNILVFTLHCIALLWSLCMQSIREERDWQIDISCNATLVDLKEKKERRELLQSPLHDEWGCRA